MGRALAAAAAALVFVAALAARARRDPAVAFLPGDGAPWIVAARPFELKAAFTRPDFVHFRRRFTVGAAAEGELRLRARRESQVVLDGKLVLPRGEAAGGWKSERRVVLRPAPGEHELLIVVRAEPGPAALSAEVAAWGLSTGPDWQASADGAAWAPVRLAALPYRAEEFAGQVTAARGFLRALPWLLLVAGGAFWAARCRDPGRLTPRALRGACAGVLTAWALLAGLSWARLDPAIGFDAEAHIEHARIVAEQGRLPGAAEGWQMFEPPLHFVLVAALRRAASGLLTSEELARLSRVPSLLAGALLGPLCLLAARAARPGRPDAELAALLVGAFLPASLASAQGPSGQSLSAALAAGAFACALHAARRGGERLAAVSGALLGLAALAKATAFVSIPPVAAALMLGVHGRRGHAVLLASGAFLLACGAHYGPVWLEHGKPVLGGWDLSGAWAWSQDPGYRVAGDFLRFGESLVRPVYSGVAGFWDALYSTFFLDGWQSGMITVASRPPWPSDWQAASAWWGLVPAALACAGAARALRRGDPEGSVALGALALGAAALLWLFLSLPIYSTVKASYLLGLTPAFALLVGDGLDALKGRARAGAWALLAAWAACAYVAHLAR